MSKTPVRRPKASGPKSVPDDGTRRFYEAHADEYAHTTRIRALAPQLADFSRRLAGGSVLDLGCGAGYDLASFRLLGHPVAGLDYSEAITKIARSTAQAPVVVADMRGIPFRSQAFDGVWASASFLHLPRPDVVAALAEVRRVLKPGGLLFASLKRGTGELLGGDGRFFAFYQADDWQQLLTAAGFRTMTTAFNGGLRKGAEGLQEQWMTSLATSE
ncbi:SAM-dependent methyltransferase [Bradyrhizobium sp. USDA 4501]